MKRQNFYASLNNNNEITSLSNQFSNGWTPIAVPITKVDNFIKHYKGVKYDPTLDAILNFNNSNSAPVYGAETNFGSTGSNSQLIRLGAAKGLKFGINGAQDDFDKAKPWSDMKKVTDSKGNVFVRIPKLYIKKSKVGTGKSAQYTWEVSESQFPGSYLPQAFIGNNGQQLPYVDVGAYFGNTQENTQPYTSKSGTSIGEYGEGKFTASLRDKAQQNGKGYQLLDWSVYDVVSTLAIIESANLAPSAFGVNNGFSEASNTGLTNNGNGSISTKQNVTNYHGIEGIFGIGTSSTFVDGIGSYNNNIYIADNPSDYGSFSANSNNWKNTGIQLPSSSMGNVTEISYNAGFPEISLPIATSGFQPNSYFRSLFMNSGEHSSFSGLALGFGGTNPINPPSRSFFAGSAQSLSGGSLYSCVPRLVKKPV